MNFFSNSYIFERVSRGKKLLYKKVTVFYELINEICFIFLFLLQSIFSADTNVKKKFLVNATLYLLAILQGIS